MKEKNKLRAFVSNLCKDYSVNYKHIDRITHYLKTGKRLCVCSFRKAITVQFKNDSIITCGHVPKNTYTGKSATCIIIDDVIKD